METISATRLMDVNEVARSLRVSVQSVRRWAKEQRLPSLKLGTRMLFNPADVTRFVENARRGTGERKDQIDRIPRSCGLHLHFYIRNGRDTLLLPNCYVCGEPITDFEHANIVGPEPNEHPSKSPVRTVDGIRLQREDGEILAVHWQCDSEQRVPWCRLSSVLKADQRSERDRALGLSGADHAE